MSIDTVKLINQYAQGAGKIRSTGGASRESEPDFDRTLSNIISGNEAEKRFSHVAEFSEDIKDKVTTNTELDDIFKKAAETYDVPEELLKAVAKAESGFNPNAVSKCGAMGVMQLMPGTAKSLGVVDSFDPEQNIMAGASYLSQKLKKYDGDITLTLAAYNAGSGNVAKYGGVPPFAETQNYIKKIFGYMGEDIELPDQVVRTEDSPKDNLLKRLSGDATFSQMGTEKAYFTAQLQILKQQLDLQNIFAMGTSSDEEEDSEKFDINQLIDSLDQL